MSIEPRHLQVFSPFTWLVEAAGALGANRLRSLLTILGMVIGVASVILMVAIGEGSRQKVAQSLSQLGTETLVVFAGSSRSGGLRGAAGGLPTLTLEDAQAMADLLSVRDVTAVHSTGAQVVWGGNNTATSVTGGDPSYFDVAGWQIERGNGFSRDEARAAANVALLGSTVARTLFGQVDPIGQVIRIQKQPFAVIGLLRSKGQSMMGNDQDDVIVVPVRTAQRKLSGTSFTGSVSTIMARAVTSDQVALAQQEITLLLRQRHRIRAGADDDFSVRSLGAVADVAAATSRILSVLLGSIAFISLLVGGIGIMNIMLVSVTERTREIGLRMALGASRRHVLTQFLLESVMLSVIGGVVGIVLGLVGGMLVQSLAGLSVVFSSAAVALAFAVASGVGVLFGYWPAAQASRLAPVEALRYA